MDGSGQGVRNLRLPGRESLLTIIGMAFMWPYPLFKSATFFFSDLSSDNLLSLTATDVTGFELAYSLALIAAALACLATARRVSRAAFLHWRALVCAVGACGVTAGAVVSASGGTSAMGPGPALAYAVGSALWLVGGLVLWGFVLSGHDTTVMAREVCASFLAYIALYLVAVVLGAPTDWYLLACPAVCWACLLALPAPQEGPLQCDAGSVRAAPIGFLVSALVFVVSAVALSILWRHDDAAGLSLANRLATLLPSAAVMGAMTAVCTRGTWSRRVELVLFSCVAMCVALSIVAVIVLSDFDMPFSSRRIVMATVQCLSAYFVIVLAGTAGRRKVSPAVLFPLFAVTTVGVPRLLCTALHLAGADTGAWLALSRTSVAALAAFAVMLAAMIPLVSYALREGGASTGAGTGSPSDGGELGVDGRSRCAAAARLAGLSAREADALACFYQGMDMRETSEAMYIAEATAKTYAKRVYAKLGVHTRAQLVEFVDGMSIHA